MLTESLEVGDTLLDDGVAMRWSSTVSVDDTLWFMYLYWISEKERGAQMRVDRTKPQTLQK